MSTSLARSAPPPYGPEASAAGHPTRQQLDELDALLQRMLALPVSHAEDELASALDSFEVPSPAARTEPAPVAPGGPPGPPPPAPAAREHQSWQPTADPWSAAPVSYPPSYMVVETAGPVLPLANSEPAPVPAAPAGGREAPFAPGTEEAEPDGPSRMGLKIENGRPDPSALGTATAEPEVWVPLRSSWQPSAQTWKPLAESWEQARATAGPAVPPVPESEPAPPPAAPAAPAPPPAESSVVGVWSGREVPEARPASGAPAPPPPAAGRRGPEYPKWAVPLVWFNRAFDACLAPWGPPGRWLTHLRGRAVLGTVGLLCLAGAIALAVADGIGWTW